MLISKFKKSHSKINEIINDVKKTKQGEFYGNDITIEGYSIWVSGDENSAEIKFNDDASIGEIPPIPVAPTPSTYLP